MEIRGEDNSSRLRFDQFLLRRSASKMRYQKVASTNGPSLPSINFGELCKRRPMRWS